MAIEIVPFQENVYEQLVNIWHEAVRRTHTFLMEEDFQFYHRMIQNGALQETELWIACNQDKEPIGFIGLDGAKVEALFVDPHYHRQGIGNQLLKHAQNIKGFELRIDVNEQNEDAYTFYKRFGFVQTGRSERDGSGRPYPILHLEYRAGNER